jgi:hypothetical protein
MGDMRRRVLLGIALAALAVPAWAQTPPTILRGTVDSLNGDMLSVTVGPGIARLVTLKQDATVTQVVPSSLAAITPGSFVGTAAVPGKGGVLVALEVHIFPEAQRGLGEGHRDFDLQPQSTMTNGTVGDVVGTTERTLTVRYKGGEQTVQVPPETPIVTFEPGSRALLVPGAHINVFATKGEDGAYTAARVLVGKDGLVPPM